MAATETEDDRPTRAGTALRGWPRWKQIALGTLKRFSNRDNTPRAAGTAFFGFLSLFPAIATAVLIYGFFLDEDALEASIEPLRGVLPEATLEIVEGQLARLAEQPEATLSFGLLISIPLLLWSASRGVDAILYAVSQVRNRAERRHPIVATLYAVGFTIGGSVFVVLALAAIAILPAIMPFIGPEGVPMYYLRWPILLAITVLAFAVLYRFGPDHKPSTFTYIWPGALLASVLWMVASIGFSIYVENWGDYDATFGALSAAAVMMFWMFISAHVLILGAAFNAEIERADTGEPPLQPPKVRIAKERRKAETHG